MNADRTFDDGPYVYDYDLLVEGMLVGPFGGTFLHMQSLWRESDAYLQLARDIGLVRPPLDS